MAAMLALAPAAAHGEPSLTAAAAEFRQACHAADWMAPRVALGRALWQRIDETLATAASDADFSILARRLETEAAAQGGDCHVAPDTVDRFGRVSVFLGRTGPYVEVRTTLGLVCGNAIATALYHRTPNGWRRFWRDMGDGTPSALLALRVVEDGDRNLVLVAERGQWCDTAWQPLRLRLWRAGPGTPPALLWERREYAHWGTGDDRFALAFDGHRLRVAFDVASIDASRGQRHVIRHFSVEGDTVRRRDPVAAGPAEFVEEWLNQPWQAAADWTEPSARDGAGRMHALLRGRGGAPSLSGIFAGAAERCRHDSSLWQVRMDFADLSPERRSVTFLIRAGQGGLLRMTAVRHAPWPDCTVLR